MMFKPPTAKTSCLYLNLRRRITWFKRCATSYAAATYRYHDQAWSAVGSAPQVVSIALVVPGAATPLREVLIAICIATRRRDAFGRLANNPVNAGLVLVEKIFAAHTPSAQAHPGLSRGIIRMSGALLPRPFLLGK